MRNQTETVDALLARTMEHVRANRSWPQSTYRVQLNSDFTFRDAAALVPYLAELGITHLYASPYLRAQAGSTHGYDVIDHSRLNPELGGEADFEAMLAALKAHGMSHILDVVPNHMGIGNNENAWWNDILENGPASPYANYFDINWNAPHGADMCGRVLIPCLGSVYGECLERGELKLSFENGRFYVGYYARRFPISPRTYGTILAGSEHNFEKLDALLKECNSLPDRCEGSDVASKRQTSVASIQSRLSELSQQPSIKKHIDDCLRTLNGEPGKPASFDRLDDLLRHQCYRLASWRTAPDEINYRRFFDVNSLAALTMEHLDVFEAAHALVFHLLADGKVMGLRIDHPDGLYDPAQYFARLQQHYVLAVAEKLAKNASGLDSAEWPAIRSELLRRLQVEVPPSGEGAHRWPLYVLGEKILAADENLPLTWATQGTSGYDFLNITNGLFVDQDKADAFTQLYREFTGNATPFGELIYEKKKLIMEIGLASELHQLALRLHQLAQRSRHSIDFTVSSLSAAIKETIACFGVYRTYIAEQKMVDSDEQQVRSAVDEAIRRNPRVDPAVFHFLRDTILLKFDERLSAKERALQDRFAGKFQQLTSPVTAKGVEDTAFYIYNRLLSLNEVGGEPSRFGTPPAAVHEFYQRCARDWPLSMSTLSTHDTKRSEDVRARLNVLSEIPDEFAQQLREWSRMNEPHRAIIAGAPAPDRNDEYAIYQTLLGGWPLEPNSREEFSEFITRVQAAVLKSLRESKVHTTWTQPNEGYEKGVRDFINAIVDPLRSREFLVVFRPFQEKIGRHGVINSLSQTVLKLTSPGVPDTYQGTECFDFSFVDPDNRRPVDFALRRGILSTASDGRHLQNPNALKLHVHQRLLHLRKAHPELFTSGEYFPLEIAGTHARSLFAFARMDSNAFAIIVVPRLTTQLKTSADAYGFQRDTWDDTRIIVPTEFPVGGWREVISDRRIEFTSGTDRSIAANVLFQTVPVAVLLSAAGE